MLPHKNVSGSTGGVGSGMGCSVSLCLCYLTMTGHLTAMHPELTVDHNRHLAHSPVLVNSSQAPGVEICKLAGMLCSASCRLAHPVTELV